MLNNSTTAKCLLPPEIYCQRRVLKKIRYLHNQSDMLTDGEKGRCVQFAAAGKYGAKRTITGTVAQKTEEQNNINILQTSLRKP